MGDVGDAVPSCESGEQMERADALAGRERERQFFVQDGDVQARHLYPPGRRIMPEEGMILEGRRSIVSVRAAARTLDYLHAFRNAIRSASSCGVNCLSSPAGMIDTLPGRTSSMSSRGDAHLLVRGDHQDDLIRGVLLRHPAKGLAVLGADDQRLVAADEAGAREQDRFEEVAFGADAADRVRSGPCLPPTYPTVWQAMHEVLVLLKTACPRRMSPGLSVLAISSSLALAARSRR